MENSVFLNRDLAVNKQQNFSRNYPQGTLGEIIESELLNREVKDCVVVDNLPIKFDLEMAEKFINNVDGYVPGSCFVEHDMTGNCLGRAIFRFFDQSWATRAIQSQVFFPFNATCITCEQMQELVRQNHSEIHEMELYQMELMTSSLHRRSHDDVTKISEFSSEQQSLFEFERKSDTFSRQEMNLRDTSGDDITFQKYTNDQNVYNNASIMSQSRYSNKELSPPRETERFRFEESQHSLEDNEAYCRSCRGECRGVGCLSKRCYACRATGHLMANCPFLSKKERVHKTPQSDKLRNSRGNDIKMSKLRENLSMSKDIFWDLQKSSKVKNKKNRRRIWIRKCYACGRKGHLGFNCPYPPRFSNLEVTLSSEGLENREVGQTEHTSTIRNENFNSEKSGIEATDDDDLLPGCSRLKSPSLKTEISHRHSTEKQRSPSKHRRTQMSRNELTERICYICRNRDHLGKSCPVRIRK